MFNLDKLSGTQLETHMVDGTFETVWGELLAAYYDETHTRFDKIAFVLYNALSPYLKQDLNTRRPRHIYIPSATEIGSFANEMAFSFTIWDDYQREYVFEMAFAFKEK